MSSHSTNDDDSSAALALESSFESREALQDGGRKDFGPAAMRARSQAPSGSLDGNLLQPRHATEVLGGLEVASERDVIASEQMGFRLAREISHLRDRVSKWKEQCTSLETRLSSAEEVNARLAGERGDLRVALQESRAETAALRREVAALETDRDDSMQKKNGVIGLKEEMIKAKEEEVQNLRVRVAETKEQANNFKIQMQASQAQNALIEKDVLDRAKSTEGRLRTRCSRLATTIAELKAAVHKSDCEVVELRKSREELSTVLSGYKTRSAVMEEEEKSRLAEVTRLQGLVRESSISLAQCNVELMERDRASARAQSVIDDLQNNGRNVEDQKAVLERQLRESMQEIAHIRAIAESAALQAEDFVSRAKEGERKAQRELAAERYRSETAVSEANERNAEIQRQLQKQLVEQRHKAEESRHTVVLELAEARRALDCLNTTAARGVSEARSTATDALKRLECQLDAAQALATKFERLYDNEVAKRKRGVDEESARQIASLKSSSRQEILRLEQTVHTANERVVQLEGENKYLFSRVEGMERERERLNALQQKMERSLGAKLKDNRIGETMGLRLAEMRLQISHANEALNEVRAGKHSTEKKLSVALIDNEQLKQKYNFLKRCNKDLLKTIRKYEKICSKHGGVDRSTVDNIACSCSD